MITPVVLVCLLVSSCSRKVNPPKSMPNVVILLIDSLRADALHDYGHHRNTNPFLAEFGRKGIRFVRAYSHSSHTKVSVASLFSGLLPPVHGVRRAVFPSIVPKGDLVSDSLSAHFDTLAEVLKKEEYRTAAFVANPHIHSSFGFSQGFTHYKSYPWTRTNAHLMNRDAIRWLRKSSKSPFFLYIHYMDVHHPYRPPINYRFLYTEKKRLGIIKHNGPWRRPISKETIQYTRDIYEAQINYWDACFRIFMNNMERGGWFKNTLFIILSDHGEEFYDHGGFGHGFTLYDEELNIPLYLVMEGTIPSYQVRNDPVQVIDLFPTVCFLARRNLDELGLPGKNLFDPNIRKRNLKRTIYAETFKGRVPRSLQTKKFKLIHNTAENQFEFYHLDKDPKELQNFYEEGNPLIDDWKAKLLLMAEGVKSATKIKKLDPEVIEQLKSLGYIK